MKLSTMLVPMAAPLILAGCGGAYWGNLIVLAISAGVFFGTLTLGRVESATRTKSDASRSAEPVDRNAA